jgi:endonuclease III
MKTKNADALKSLAKSFAKEGKAPPMEKLDALKALVRGAMSFDVSDQRADEAVKAIDREFVNLNELRVATDLEIQEMLGTRYPAIEQRVQMITRCLNAIFEKEHTMSLDRLKTISKRDARQFVRELPEMTPFVEAYVALYGFETPAIPVDQETVNLLREEGIIDDKSNIEETQRFLEHHIKAEDCYDFFVALRKAIFGRKKAAKA